jgi:SAM-dependent methyltransferase
VPDERSKWESRYSRSAEPFYGRSPSAFLARSLTLLPPRGRCLDLAGGEGRNAAFLAERGFSVTITDLAIAGLARARSIRGVSCPLRLLTADLDRPPWRDSPGRFDLVLMINFHHRPLLAAAREWIAPGGALLLEGFACEQAGRTSGGPPDPEALWRPNEVLDAATRPLRGTSGLRVVWYEDRLFAGDDNPRHQGEKWVVRLIARRE